VEAEALPVALMNTIWADRDGVHDTLDAGAADWLRTATDVLLADVPRDGVALGADPREEIARLRRLRDALRRLAAELTDDPRPDAASAIPDLGAALTALNETCALATAWPALVWPDDAAPPHAAARTAHPLSTLALARLAAQAVELLARPSGLGACVAPGCVRYFVRDHPRRGWCSAACGNRARVARHYRRHHGSEG
jgi:predicted RNA-binding Zn ribbon-like protein